MSLSILDTPTQSRNDETKSTQRQRTNTIPVLVLLIYFYIDGYGNFIQAVQRRTDVLQVLVLCFQQTSCNGATIVAHANNIRFREPVPVLCAAWLVEPSGRR
jgi:hypothetical protein